MNSQYEVNKLRKEGDKSCLPRCEVAWEEQYIQVRSRVGFQYYDFLFDPKQITEILSLNFLITITGVTTTYIASFWNQK